MKKILFFFIFLCAVNLNAQIPKQITFTDQDCKTPNAPSGLLTWQDVNEKLRNEFNVTIPDIPPDYGRVEEITVPFTVIITEDITMIGELAFNWLTTLESVDMPVANTIGSNAFAECHSLKSVNMPAVTKIETAAFTECGLLENINIPLATIIELGTFYSCSNLKTINIPLIETIEDETFAFCGLVNVNMPAVTKIGLGAFAFCTSLKDINIPLIKTIGDWAFNNCSSLKSITILNLTPPTLGEDVFGTLANPDFLVPGSCTLRVANQNAVRTYKNDKSWKKQFLPRAILPVSP